MYHKDDSHSEDFFKKSWVEENWSTLVYTAMGVVALIVLLCCCSYRRHRNRGRVLTVLVVPPPPPPGPGVASSPAPAPCPQQQYVMPVAGAPLAPPSYEQATHDRDIYEKNPPYNPHHNPSY